MRKVLRVAGLKGEGSESVVTPVAGSVRVRTDQGQLLELGEKDVCYLPLGSVFSLEADAQADVIWARAPGTERFAQYVRRFADVKPVVSGAESYRRHIYTSIGEKEPANRLIVGFVEGDAGNWTSFPPHKHDGKPEVYVYYGMGARFGVQIVAAEEDEAYVVREGDAVLFERGYHPNVATPGVGMKFVWIISADPRERNLSVELHPDYKEMPMGQTHLSTK
ncbi:MAG: 5-deoxy-glucuronate isomerase [Candidatus Gagatemarchaeaceae archaeon]